MLIYLQMHGQNKFEKEEEILANEFIKRGHIILPFYEKDMLRNRIKVTKDDLVAGNITVMHNVFRQLGVEVPATHDYPAIIQPYLKRKVWSGDLQDILGPIYNGTTADIFIKPKSNLKKFTGFIVRGVDDLYQLGNISTHTEVWASEVVCWISEFRVFVVNGQIRGTCYYNGNPDVLLDESVVHNTVALYEASGEAPSAYGIDFGVMDTGETALIEVNDGYSLGCYDLDGKDYADIIETRWNEIIHGGT